MARSMGNGRQAGTPSAGGIEDRLINAYLSMAGEEAGLKVATLPALARRAEIPLARIYALYDDPSDILVAWARRLDRAVEEGVGDPDPDVPARERLFDVLMERFERLNDDRPGSVALLLALRRDPARAAMSLALLVRSMTRMLEAAGLETGGWRGLAHIAGAVALWLKVSAVWTKDESADLGRTMAALDQALEQAEKIRTFAEKAIPSNRFGVGEI